MFLFTDLCTSFYFLYFLPEMITSGEREKQQVHQYISVPIQYTCLKPTQINHSQHKKINKKNARLPFLSWINTLKDHCHYNQLKMHLVALVCQAMCK